MQHSRLHSDVSFLGHLLSYLHDEGIIVRESTFEEQINLDWQMPVEVILQEHLTGVFLPQQNSCRLGNSLYTLYQVIACWK